MAQVKIDREKSNLSRIRELTFQTNPYSEEAGEEGNDFSYVHTLEEELLVQKKTLEVAEREIERLKIIISKFLGRMIEKNSRKKETKNVPIG